jgi:LuxR family maltose regulon positive regulatory protein
VQRFKVGDVSAAQDAARRVLQLNRGEVCFAATVANLILGLTLVWHGELIAAQRPLRDAVRLARRTDNRLAEAYALGYLALAAVERGAMEEAEQLLKPALDRAADPGVAEHFVAMMPHLAHATVLAASGELTGAVTTATRAVQLARRGAGRLELALALAMQAQTCAATGGDGHTALEEARALVRGCRDPGWLPDRLTRLRREVTARQSTEGRSLTPSGAAEPPDRIVLSDRERELLPLLGGTLSQREIGAVLHVSLNTVKTHSRLLFRKLGVSSRAEAVARARALGLLPEPRGQSTLASSSADTGSVANPVTSRPSSRARSINP